MRGVYRSATFALSGGVALLVCFGSLGARAQSTTSNIELNPIVIDQSDGSATGPVQGFVPKRTTTGSKTNTPIEAIPQAVSVVGREQMDDQGATKIDEALRFTSGVLTQPFGSDSDTNWFYIRGFDATQKGTFLDGLQNFGYGFGGFFIDSWGIERVEVLKGPASVLYGGSNPGGIVNFISKRPTGERLRYVETGIDSFGTGYLGFDIGDKASDVVDYRINGKIQGGDGYTDLSQEFLGVISPSLTWKPDESTKFTVLANYTHLDETHGGGSFLPYYGTVLDAPFGKIKRDANFTEPGVDDYNREQAAIGYELEHTFDNDWTVRQNLRYGYGDVREHSLYPFGYVPFSEQPVGDNYDLSRINFLHDTTVNTFIVDNQLEGTVNTGPIEHTLLFGAEYKYFNIDQIQATGGATPISAVDPVYGAPLGPMFTPYIDQVLKRNQIGIYAQDQLRFGDGWLVTLNGRYDYVKTEATGTPSYDGNDGSTSGRAGIAYEFENGLSPYASVSTFFSPEIGVDANLDFLKPETGRQYEVGVKYRPTMFDGLITAALFDLTKENVLTGPFLAQYQVGEVNSRGFEIEAQANITEAWRLTAAFTALDMEVKDDADAALIGKRPYLIPEIQGSLFAQYTFQTGVLEGVAVGGGVRYVGSSYADAMNTLKVPDATLVDLKVGYKKDNWGVDLNVTNLFDKDYVSGCQGLLVCSYGEGRKALLKAHLTW
ncbi:TonB-dependent siderophore receptor [Phyllobacterium sp. SYP-B3895]|uniref:TonB-dependent siderophore receptor n=1 Tax=Phyllobacterium sp. SYP-B3895 TaxID=2663240 RepID=UPI0012999F6A|nr:TonB-dependent siderophore receptor [Phyllobacterium sp. SYP-B3895]MRG57688.1 TonB-dependent siderophore receptor [Phyllobacterium sp. SYP-B3895]